MLVGGGGEGSDPRDGFSADAIWVALLIVLEAVELLPPALATDVGGAPEGAGVAWPP